mmetsp:Transcript_48822/g.145898  ORF Transcript_48822/g.145898 Transcript_48822/m.145898 type:complete len:203 (+) Transcript_48822:1245-1853(+)
MAPSACHARVLQPPGCRCPLRGLHRLRARGRRVVVGDPLLAGPAPALSAPGYIPCADGDARLRGVVPVVRDVSLPSTPPCTGPARPPPCAPGAIEEAERSALADRRAGGGGPPGVSATPPTTRAAERGGRGGLDGPGVELVRLDRLALVWRGGSAGGRSAASCGDGRAAGEPGVGGAPGAAAGAGGRGSGAAAEKRWRGGLD